MLMLESGHQGPSHTLHRNIGYCTWELFSGGKFWQAIQVKAIGKEKFGEWATVSAYAKYIFSVSVNIGEENFGE